VSRRGGSRRPLSARAVRLLTDIVVLSRAESRAVRAAEVIPSDFPALYNTLLILSDRWLIAVDGDRIRPRQAGVHYLRSRGVI